MIAKFERRSLGKWMLVTGVIYSILVVLWLILTFITLPSGSIEQQLKDIAERLTLYNWSFVNASLISIPLLALMVILGLFVETRKQPGFIDLMGVIFLAPYTLLVSIAYTSQYTILPRLLAGVGETDIVLAKAWYFGNSSSIAYFLDLLGYTFFSISALAIGFKFLKEKGLQKVIGWLMWLSALTAIIGFVGFAIENSVLEQGIIVSGVLTLPFALLVAIWGAKLRTDKESTPSS